MQKWKTDPNLHNCSTRVERGQIKKNLDYNNVYVPEFLGSDPIRDWESIERCKSIWRYCVDAIGVAVRDLATWKVLDCGTKDGQFPEFLRDEVGVGHVTGVEICDAYVRYAEEKGRPVVKGDICDMPEHGTGLYDFVFGNHVLGLTRDYRTGLMEMARVTRRGAYLAAVNDIPGDRRKHYSYVDSMATVYAWLEAFGKGRLVVMYFGNVPKRKRGNEKLLLVRKE